METSLKSRTIKALSWSFVQEASQRGLQIIIGIGLARMLEPKEFGLVAMLTIFIAVSHALLDSGFGSALIQRKETTETDESSVFYFNLVIGFIMAGVLYVMAPWVADFYGQPPLTAIMRALAPVLVINSFAVVQNSMMIRRLDFKHLTLVSVASTAVSGTVGVTLAWHGFGVWSLVAQQLMDSAVRASLLWVFNPWRPQWVFSWKSLREMFGFGSGMMASALMNTLFENLNSLVIGKLFAAATLGYYNRAQSLQSSASQSLSTIANRVTFPVFSQLQNDCAKLKRGLQKAMTTLAFVQFPLLVGLAAIARPLVLFVLTAKWAPSIPLLQLLCFAGLLYPMHTLNLNVLMALGRSDLFFRLNMIKRVLIIVSILVTYRWGVQAMVWGQVVNSGVAYFVNSYYTKRFIGYSIPEQLRDLYPYLTASVLMGVIVFLVKLPLPPAHPAQLGLKIATGAAVYWVVCRGLRVPALGEVTNLMRRRSVATA